MSDLDNLISWDEVRRRNYVHAMSSSTHWFKLADDLLQSAKLLKPRAAAAWRSWQAHSRDKSVSPKLDHYTATYLMLTAYAVENILKGTLVAREGAALRADPKFLQRGLLPDVLKGHNLLDLALRLNLQLDRRAQEALLRLERSAVWAGRYPVPLNYRDTNNRKMHGGTPFHVGYLSASDLTYLAELVIDLRRHLEVGTFRSEFRTRRLKNRRKT
jgi:hypothetical protein